MWLVSRSKTAGYSVRVDSRLERRWKRRGLGLGSCSNAVPKQPMHQKRRKNDAFVETLTIDSDYEKFLNEWKSNLDSNVVNDARCMYHADNDGTDDNITDIPDPDYRTLLVSLKEEKWYEDYADWRDGEENISNVPDPQYLNFLNNLKVDGKSYVLELALDNKAPFVKKYEKERGSDDGLDVVILETANCCENEDNRGSENILISHRGREKSVDPEFAWRSNLGRNKYEISSRVQRSGKLERSGRVLGSNSRRQESDGLRVICRSTFETEQTESPRKVVWSNSSGRKTSKGKLTRKSNEGPSITHSVMKIAKTESKRTLSHSRRKNNENLRSNSRGRKTDSFWKTLRGEIIRKGYDSPSNMHDVVKREKTEDRTSYNSRRKNNESLNILHDALRREKAENARTFKGKLGMERMRTRKSLEEPVVGKKVKRETENFISNARYNCPSKRHRPNTITNSAADKCNHGEKSKVANGSFLEFMKSVKGGQHMVYAPGGGTEVVYEDHESDSEVVILNHNPFSDGSDTSSVAIGDEGCREFVRRSSQHEFREKLVEILRKPYDRKECNRLILRANQRMPVEHGNRLDYDGKSYLDHYPDLAVLVDQAQGDKPRILNLLRGLFYHLQNVTNEMEFIPWLDSECLSILPPTSGNFSSVEIST